MDDFETLRFYKENEKDILQKREKIFCVIFVSNILIIFWGF